MSHEGSKAYRRRRERKRDPLELRLLELGLDPSSVRRAIAASRREREARKKAAQENASA